MRNSYRRRAFAVLGSLIAVAVVSGRSAAQPAVDSSHLSVGVYGGFDIVQHDASFMGIPTVPTCSPGFQDGSGSGNGFGGLLHYRIDDAIAIQLRLGYSSSTGTTKVRETIGNVVQGGEVVQAVTEHAIEAKITTFDIEPRVVIMPLPFPLSISIGLQYGNVVGATFDQTETIVSPSNVRFYSGLARNHRSGDIQDATSLYMAVLGGVGYDLPLSKRLTLTPEVSYHRGLTKVIPDTAWIVSGLRFGLSLRLRLGGPKDTASDSPVLTAAVVANKVDAETVGGTVSKMHVEEFVSPQLRPLLNYVFFEEGSQDLPGRYVRLGRSDVSRFNISSLQNLGVLPTYYNILNVVGWRMRRNTAATVTLVGCNSDEGAEKGKMELSRGRAEAVRDYLRDTWGIADDRIKVDARNLPEKASSSSAEGREENRRVELRSSVPEILEPIFTVDTTLTTEPDGIRFGTTVRAEAGVSSWKLTAQQGGVDIKTYGGSGPVPSMLSWDLENDRPSIPRGAQQVEYRLEVTDSTGQHVVTPPGTIAVEQVTVKEKRETGTADREINRYSLILFEYGKSDVSDANKVIVDFIKSRISPGAKVEITGHTDRAGDASVNQRLSEERARVVAKALGVQGASVKGLGESVLLYDNDLPEGRFYCRVVNVVVETVIGR